MRFADRCVCIGTYTLKLRDFDRMNGVAVNDGVHETYCTILCRYVLIADCTGASKGKEFKTEPSTRWQQIGEGIYLQTPTMNNFEGIEMKCRNIFEV